MPGHGHVGWSGLWSHLSHAGVSYRSHVAPAARRPSRRGGRKCPHGTDPRASPVGRPLAGRRPTMPAPLRRDRVAILCSSPFSTAWWPPDRRHVASFVGPPARHRSAHCRSPTSERPGLSGTRLSGFGPVRRGSECATASTPTPRTLPECSADGRVLGPTAAGVARRRHLSRIASSLRTVPNPIRVVDAPNGHLDRMALNPQPRDATATMAAVPAARCGSWMSRLNSVGAVLLGAPTQCAAGGGRPARSPPSR
jgi:hypothetical protein